MKIVAVCGFGVGSSVIAKMNIESILQEEGKDAEVATVDLGSITSVSADIYVTTRELFENFPEEYKPKTIVLTNFVDKTSIKKSLDEKISSLNT